ncbi:MAG: glucokinase [Burkholderiales bacterium]|nr:glucokinase [Burkholderiales bacterium]
MNPHLYPRLLGDVGGTNARFAWQQAADRPIVDVASLPCAQHASIEQAIRHYLSTHSREAPRAGAIGIANPVTGDRVQMTNHHWSFSISALRQSLGLTQLVVINDFTALALALPALPPSGLRPIGGGQAIARAPLAVLGPGTGLGVSGLLPSGDDGWIPISGEGGHVTLAAADERDAAVIDILRRRFGHASAERALSGPGLVNLRLACRELAGQPADERTPAQVLASARDGSDADSAAALDLFCGFLGGVAGNLALTLGAQGGVFLGGGIVPRMADELGASVFRERFESKGRFSGYLAAIPTTIIATDDSPALIGAGRALDQAR